MDVYGFEFDGSLLRRGFWLYVWIIQPPDGKPLIYVGRTGDTSSPNAQSPFRRVGQHVDPNPKSKSNALTKRLRELKIEPDSCHFAFTAIGPIFQERKTMERHVRFRNRTAALERRVSEWFKGKGFHLIGSHPKLGKVDEELWGEIEDHLQKRFATWPPKGRPP